MLSFSRHGFTKTMSLPQHERLVLGRYLLGPVIGRGGAGTVYQATDTVDGAAVAVKEIPVSHEMARRAGAEIRATSRLEHPAIVRLLNFDQDTHAVYLISELVDGDTLATHYRSEDADDHLVFSVMADIFAGLAHAHLNHVTHRDVKPGNILVDRNGRGQLADFGIARIAGDQGLTQTGNLIGTMSYMSPEHARGDDAGPSSDVYSACIVLREGLTGHNPLASSNQLQTLRRAGEGVATSLAADRPDLPRNLIRLVDAGLSRDPRERPSAAAMAEALERIVAGQAVRRPTGARRAAGERTAGADGRRRVAGRVAGAVAVAGAGALVADRFFDPTAVALWAGAGMMAAAFLWAPWVSTLAAVAAGAAFLAPNAPALAGLLGAIALLVMVPFKRSGHLLALVVAAPVLASAGLTTALVLAVGLIPSWGRRLWTAGAAMLVTLLWQVTAGADPALDGGRLSGLWPDVRDLRNPIDVYVPFSDQLRDRPSLGSVALLTVVAAAVLPLVLRVRSPQGRIAGVGALLVAMVAAVVALGGSLENTVQAMIGGGIILAVGAVIPAERLRFGARPPEAVTLHANMERERTA